MPILLYATDFCPIKSRDTQSLEFAITRLFMKIFRTGSPAIVAECHRNFNFLPVKHQLCIRTAKFLQRFIASENVLCSLFSPRATRQLNCLFAAYGNNIHTAGQLTAEIYRLNNFFVIN